MSTMTADWPADAVLDEIYPQSFADSDGDGVGDLRGVIEHLDHLGWLGVDTIWFNPLLDSPFVDAGYDVADYLRVAPRYGTNHDLVELVGKARDRGIRVLLDLVAGHTSLEHPWFQAELHADGPHPDGNRYVWRGDPPRTAGSGDVPGTPAWVRQPGPRRGWYLKNFYDAQRALNFGWGAPAHRRAVAGRRRRARPAPRLQGVHRRARLLAEPRRGRGSGWTWPSHWSRTIPAGAWRDERHPDAVLVPEGGAQGHIGRARGDDGATPCLSDVR
jgi:maltose alpha-D-glucosyltransferase/alpha-amylase